ncbi:MAG: S-layer homology domain-containing protein, partial [Tissierellia bacterium]|nr:S-layer homology domain-containing protein [Tissierellia bacterium]
TLKDITITDEMFPNLELNKTELAPGEEATATATYTVTQADMDAGFLQNTATVKVVPPKGVPISKTDTVRLPAIREPSFKFKKTTDKSDDYTLVAGETIKYTFTVENTGNVTLTDVKVEDNLEGLSTITWDKTEIAPKDCARGTASYTITQEDVDKGKVVNTATASAKSPDENNPPENQIAIATVPAISNPGFEFTKTTNKDPNHKLSENEEIIYTFAVKNTGNVTLNGLILEDKMFDVIVFKPTEIAPGEEATATAKYIVTADDIKAGKVTNEAKVRAWNPDGEEISKSASVTLGTKAPPSNFPIYPPINAGALWGPDQFLPNENIALNKEYHYAYMFGYPQMDFRPDIPMTRAEVAVLFTRLSVETGDPGESATEYSDVSQGSWYSDAVNYLSKKGIIKGYKDNTFRPNNFVTRAEFAAIASRYERYSGGNAKLFPDVDPNHWAVKDIINATTAGWINGYPDGTFKPNKSISRAEVVTIVNKMLNRYGDHEFIVNHILDEEMRDFTDLKDANYWAYNAIMEATNGHEYERLEDGHSENWLLLNEKDFYYDKHMHYEYRY